LLFRHGLYRLRERERCRRCVANPSLLSRAAKLLLLCVALNREALIRGVRRTPVMDR
jgi:hypothetical protein